MDPKSTASQGLEADVLEAVDPSRREFLETLLKGAAFAAPMIASFSMGGLSLNNAEASPLCVGNMACTAVPRPCPRKYVSRFEDTNAANRRIDVEAVLRVAEDNLGNSQISYKLDLSRRAMIDSFQIVVNGAGEFDPALTFGSVDNFGIVVSGPLSHSSQGVVTQANVFPNDISLDEVLAVMSTGCARLIVFLSDGSTLIGPIQPRRDD